jgi:hypothetical protein
LTGNDFDRVFGGATAARPGFTERLGRAGIPGADGSLPAESATDPRQYRAYGFLPTGNVGETCEVARWVDGTDIPEGIEFQYRFLLSVAYHGETELRLHLPEAIVVIGGRQLRELRKKLARRQVTFIQQWSERVWPGGPTSGEAVVESILILRPNSETERK